MKIAIRFLSVLTFLLFNISNSKAQWTEQFAAYGGIILTMTTESNTTYAGTTQGIYLSTDNGNTWNGINNGLPDNIIVRSIIINGVNLFIGTDKGVFLSTDNGNNWITKNTGLNAVMTGIPVPDVRTIAINGSNMFTGTYGDGDFLSTDNGNNWSSVSTGANYVNSIVANGANIFVGSDDAGVVLSTNNGSTWASANTGLSNLFISALVLNGTDLFACTGSSLYLSTDNGSSWQSKTVSINTLAISGNKMFGGGYWIRSNFFLRLWNNLDTR